MRARLALVALSVVACKPPPEAPAEVTELSAYLFREFDAEDEEVLAVGVQNLEAILAEKDMTADLNDRAVTLTVLQGEDLGGITPPAGIDAAAQVPVAVWASSTHGLTDHKALVSDPNQICIASDSTVYQSRAFTTDLACWESGECRWIDTTNEVRTETALADVWMDILADYRLVALADGRDAMISRGLMPEQYLADGGNNSWDQRYTVDVWIPGADGAAPTLRYYAMWSSVTLGGVGDDIYANLVKSGLDEYYVNTDAWIDGTACDNDRDRAYDRPQ